MSAGDWGKRLRDRLGLAHLVDKRPVALMGYTVREVKKQALRAGAAHALAVPTVLDAEPYEVFHPSPDGLPYGRALNLGADSGDCDRVASEILHLSIDFAPPHILKVGAIVEPADTAPTRLLKLRKDHLFCLQYQSDQHGYGSL